MGKIWLLEREDDIGWDEFRGFVIAANTEGEARDIAALNHADEVPETWQGQLTCTVRCIADNTDEPNGIVLESFNAG